jgi:DNA-binding PadR family transcriptional regulator
MKLLTRTEELLLLTVWKLRKDAYSLSIQDAMAELLGKSVSIGAVYIPLERLAKRGLLKTREAAPTEKRGGRRKRFYEVTARGQAALAAIDSLQKKAWEGWATSAADRLARG